MTSAMWKLRNAIWDAGLISRKDKKRFRWLTEGYEQQRAVVMTALGDGHPLKVKMTGCGKIEDPDADYMRHCGVPLCPRCFSLERSKQIKQATRERFACVGNHQLAFATILLPLATNLSEVDEIHETTKTRLRNIVAKQRRKDSRWDNFELVGWWEMDRMVYGDIEQFGRNTRIAVEDLGVPLVYYNDTTIWRPHFHAIIRLEQLTIDEVNDALRKSGYGASYQVLIKPLADKRRVGLNLKKLIQYALKFRIEDDYKDSGPVGDATEYEYDLSARKWWPDADIKAYAEWLCQKHAGFQSLRFSLGPKGKTARKSASDIAAANTLIPTQNLNTSLDTARDDIEGTISLLNANENRDDHFTLNESNECSLKDYSFHASYFEDEGIIDWSDGAVAVRYKNPLQDTNWTDDLASKCALSFQESSNSVLHTADTATKTSRYAGNVVGLAERLHGGRATKQASGDQGNGTTR
ncbi:hypothetical protein MNR02_14695 [Shinella sp. H4-D48]|uniref:hypothetical protein n=1 Tax=Shinella sp. H4-D48 TaxID=2925841 RepID=UPI001F533A0A|nr:hypothetical protein [Shinella sp. H4-D48]UNK37696.1 hypothetical protein MNR02_14695 [Shinella sp. H4-D48]